MGFSVYKQQKSVAFFTAVIYEIREVILIYLSGIRVLLILIYQRSYFRYGKLKRAMNSLSVDLCGLLTLADPLLQTNAERVVAEFQFSAQRTLPDD